MGTATCFLEAPSTALDDTVSDSVSLTLPHLNEGMREQTPRRRTAERAIAVVREFEREIGENFDPQASRDDGQHGLPRIAEIGGRWFYLAVCYDVT